MSQYAVILWTDLEPSTTQPRASCFLLVVTETRWESRRRQHPGMTPKKSILHTFRFHPGFSGGAEPLSVDVVTAPV